MPVPHYASWDNPWLMPVLGTDPDPRDFVAGVVIFSTGPGAVPPDWQIGVIASEVQVTFTCVSARTVEILIYDTGSVLIGGDTFVVAPGTHTVSVPIVSQTADIAAMSFSLGGMHEAGDSVDSATVVGGSPPVSDFWTSFTKSYEIP